MNYLEFSLENLLLPIAICDATSPMTSIERDAHFGSLLSRQEIEFTWENNLYIKTDVKHLSKYRTIVFDTLYGDQEKFLHLTDFDKKNLEIVVVLSLRSYFLAKSLKEKLNLPIRILGFNTINRRDSTDELNSFFNPEEETPDDW